VDQEINYLKFGLAVDAQSAENNDQVAGEGDSVQVPSENGSQEKLDSWDESDQSEVRTEVETPEPAGV
jgi:hypothetical protein